MPTVTLQVPSLIQKNPEAQSQAARLASFAVRAHATVSTSVDGFSKIWKLLLDRFFSRYQGAAVIEIHDFGATPGIVVLRLEQTIERSGHEPGNPA